MSRRRIVVGTGRHVDHGKTTLVRGLTGVDTDRLSEEKRRGISIELGFASWELDDADVSFIDVPGHQRFVKHMIAGAVGIDVLMLVVAADEGVMPQTLEHVEICELIGVRFGFVVMTKLDLVDAELCELAELELRDALADTFLADSVVVRWSRGDGPDEIASVLTAASCAIGEEPARQHLGPAKLSVDRSFTTRGFGTVVTGTVVSGQVTVGGDLVAYPADRSTRVRRIEVHGAEQASARSGTRVALNLHGIERSDVPRGSILASPDSLEPVSLVDASLTVLARPGARVRHNSRWTLYMGTTQLAAAVSVLGGDDIAPGGHGAVQLRLEAPLAVLPGEPFVLRGAAPGLKYGVTVAGGRALVPQWQRHRGPDRRLAGELIGALTGGRSDEAVARFVDQYGQRGVRLAVLSRSLPLSVPAIEAALRTAVDANAICVADGVHFAHRHVDAIVASCLEVLERFHQQHPARSGLRTDELRTQIRPDLSDPLLACALRSERLITRGGMVSLAGFTPRRTPAQMAAREAVLGVIRSAGLTPPRLRDLPAECKLAQRTVDEAVSLLVDEGGLVRVSRELVYDAEVLATFKRRVLSYLANHDEMDTAALKELSGASRKWSIPLGEFLDRVKLTVRVGEARILRSPAGHASDP